MTDTTVRLALPELAAAQAQKHVTVNEALVKLDGLIDLYLLGQYTAAPPASPSDGDAYLTGGSCTGTWSGYDYKIACCLDGSWRFYTPYNGMRAYVASSGAFIMYAAGSWLDISSLLYTGETSIASAAACDLGAANALCVQITGTTAITSFGTGANKLRFVRFAGALTLTHNATGLVLLGGASRTTAAGDVGIYASDASGNWRERSYCRAASDPGDYAVKTSPVFNAPTINGRMTIMDGGSATVPAGIITEVTSKLLEFGINDGSENRFGTYNSSYNGGFFRFDARSGYPLLQIFGRAAGTAGTASYIWLLDATGVTTHYGNILFGSSNTYSVGSASCYASAVYTTALYAATLSLSTGIAGQTNGGDAASGYVGEYVYSTVASGSAVSLTTATAANVTSISLTAGDWDVAGLVEYTATSTTVAANAPVYAGIATSGATLTDTQYALLRATAVTTTSYAPWLAQNTPKLRLSLTATTTVYLVAQVTFTAGTMKAYGTFRARRVR